MTLVDDTLALIDRLAQALAPRGGLPRVRALHLPPPPTEGRMRGEFCALELDDGAVGLSYVLLDDTWAGLHAAGERLVQAGQDPVALARGLASTNPLARTLGVAAVNALTRHLYNRTGYEPPTSADSVGHLDPQPGELIGMVGHFTPLIPRILAHGAQLLVVELRADLVGERAGLRVTLDASELQRCRKVLLTGTLLVNGTMDSVLPHCRQAERLAMIGPSVGGPPDVLFQRGLSFLGGSWITEPRAYLEALRLGQSISPWARKVALTATDFPGWETLLQRARG